MSLASEIIQFLGPSSVPVIVGGSVLGVFELGERLTSQRAKDDLSRWLLTFDVQKSKTLPDGTQELFDRIFGERHFSWKCFIRSAAFSLGAMIFIALLFFLIDPKEVLDEITDPFLTLTVALWLPWMIPIDYISLFKTRVMLRILARVKVKRVAVVLLVIDYLIYDFIFAVGFFRNAMLLGSGAFTKFIEDFRSALAGGTVYFLEYSLGYLAGWVYSNLFIFPTLSGNAALFIVFWSGFVPSLWMWLYVLALFVTRGFLRSERIVNWLRYNLPVETNPFRSIGAVAAALAFIVSVVIIFVSVEVSRISAAS